MSRRQTSGMNTATGVLVASVCRAPYLRMVSLRQVFSLMLMLAVLLAPLGMSGSATAKVTSHEAATALIVDHCAGMDRPAKEQPQHKGDCVAMCSAIPVDRTEVPGELIGKASHQYLPTTADPPGNDPEATTPPPRRS